MDRGKSSARIAPEALGRAGLVAVALTGEREPRRPAPVALSSGSCGCQTPREKALRRYSADAGFARDMTDHHAQAVEMALIAYQRTEDEAVRLLAYDIATSQQAQIGMMAGWLEPAAFSIPSVAAVGDR